MPPRQRRQQPRNTRNTRKVKHEDRGWKMEDGAAHTALALYPLSSILHPRAQLCGPARRRACRLAAALMLALLCLSPLHARAQASMQTIMDQWPDLEPAEHRRAFRRVYQQPARAVPRGCHEPRQHAPVPSAVPGIPGLRERLRDQGCLDRLRVRPPALWHLQEHVFQ